MTLLAIDPGNDTGWALFNDQLFSCGVGTPPVLRAGSLVIEKPQIYGPANSKGDPNDLITLAIGVGRYIERYAEMDCMLVLPREWKGQVPKDICASRVFAKLTAQEQDVVATYGKGVPARLRHNMMDAIGIGLFALHRARCGMT